MIKLQMDIDDIRTGLEQGKFKNEMAVRMGIIDELLRGLGWETNDPAVVSPEYPIKGGRVDYALCHPPSKPIVLIEAKNIGKIDGAEEQLFSYAFHQGVPILVLTDGQQWRFFYTFGVGNYDERQVCALNLSDGGSEKNAHLLHRYLSYASIQNGEAVRTIENDYRRSSSQRAAAKHIPETWVGLVEGADELLLELIAEETEDFCGYRPSEEQVLQFLKNLNSPAVFHPQQPESQEQEPSTSVKPSSSLSQRVLTTLIVTMPDGERIQRDAIGETFVSVIEKLGIERVKSLNIERRECPIISTSKHPEFRQILSGSYYVLTDQLTRDKKRDLKKIADGLGIKLKVEIVPKIVPKT